MSIFEFTAWFLAAFYTLVAVFYAVLVPLRRRHYQQTTIIKMGSRNSLHWWNHLVFRVFRATIWLVCVVRLIWPEVDSALGLFSELNGQLFNLIGLLLLVLGFGLAIISNVNLRRAWRSGIDPSSAEALVQRGLYQFSRNPAFFGVGCAQIGFFVAIPSVFSLVCMLVGLTALRVQIYLEEQHLSQRFGRQYRSYQQHTPRWL